MTAQIAAVSPNQVEQQPSVSVPDTLPNRLQPWEYKSSLAPTETRKGYARFREWMDMGEETTLSAYASHIKVSLPVISRMSNKYHWRERAAAYREQSAIMKTEIEREKRHEEHQQRLEGFRVRSEQIGTGLLSASAQLLQQANNTINEMKKNGETLDRRLLAGVLQAAVKCSDQGRQLIGSSLGVEALLMGISDDGEAYD